MSTAKTAYHHGDLRTALLAAAEAELIENGIEKFSLRSCARRAGVSHAAPMHHFQSADRLLAELASVGFVRLGERMEEHMAEASSARARLLASGCGYVAFAVDNPALFKLMFSSSRPKDLPPEKAAPAAAAFAVLRDNVEAAVTPRDPDALRIDIAAAWSVVHGLSHLLIEGAPFLASETNPERRSAMIEKIVAQTLPAASQTPAGQR